jgi:hypothetical protein
MLREVSRLSHVVVASTGITVFTTRRKFYVAHIFTGTWCDNRKEDYWYSGATIEGASEPTVLYDSTTIKKFLFFILHDYYYKRCYQCLAVFLSGSSRCSNYFVACQPVLIDGCMLLRFCLKTYA